MRMFDMKGSLHDRNVLEILSYSHYMPAEQKLKSLADTYESDPNIYAFSCADNGYVMGVIVLKGHGTFTFEIMVLISFL